jgi:4-diphosphocytidyl-2-C-methyl-D-erythritol kinase
MMIVVAPAKLNLTLEVLRKCEDGYHEVRSVVQTINFCDSLKFSPNSRLEFKCNLAEWSAELSLAERAATLLAGTTGLSGKGALIEINKRIPLCSGLGGDSSDAVAILRGLNMLWGLKLSTPELFKLGAQLGSDVPLFLLGGTLLAEGKGEKIKPVHPMPHMSVILLVPRISRVEGKTRQMYSRLTPANFTRGEITQNFINILENKDKNPLAGMYNVFDRVALRFFKGLKEQKDVFLEAGAKEVHVAGAGPTLFSLMPEKAEATCIHRRLLEKGLETYLTDF